MTIAGYHIADTIAAGRLTRVVRATRDIDGASVRITLLRGASGETLEAVLAEAQRLAEAGSYHILPYYEAGTTDDGTPYVVSNDAAGETLADLIDRGGVKLEVLVSIAIQVARALKIAHALDISHLDLTPHNIIISDGADGGLVTVSGFGLRHAYPAYTRTTRTEEFHGMVHVGHQT